MKSNILDVLIIGAGQAGLTIAYYLKDTKLRYLLVDAVSTIGDSWRNRYDSLVLLTRRFEDSLQGKVLEGNPNGYPTKDEFADYLEEYAKRFLFPINLGNKIEKLSKEGENFVVLSKGKVYQARCVVVATGAFQKPFVPDIARKISSKVFQLHTTDYRNPGQIPKGNVLIVGGGNSGIQIAVELSKSHKVTLVTNRKLIFTRKFDFLYGIFTRIFSIDTIRKLVSFLKVRKVFATELEGLIKREKVILRKELKKICDGKFFFKDGLASRFDVVIWATGFKFDYKWIKIDRAFDNNGRLLQKNGVSVVNGLYIIYPTKDYGFIRDLSVRAERLAKRILIDNYL